ncbi:MAG: tol-pal system protein YbgF [candidate division NC10 bacterium]
MSRALGVVAVMAVIAAGCVGRGPVERLESEVSRLRSELSDTRAAQESAGREIARAHSELQALDARSRELGASVRAAAAEVSRLAGRIDAADEAIGRTRTALEALPPAAAPGAPASPSARESREPRVGAPAQAYAAALATFRAREHGQAVLDFVDFIAKYPRHALAGNAQYWIGEAYYVQRDFRQALLEFQKVLELGPEKAPDALVKIGLCYWSLRDSGRARQTWQQVVREYPGTAAAEIARAQLRTRAAGR